MTNYYIQLIEKNFKNAFLTAPLNGGYEKLSFETFPSFEFGILD